MALRLLAADGESVELEGRVILVIGKAALLKNADSVRNVAERGGVDDSVPRRPRT